MVIGSFIMITHPLMHHVSCRGFLVKHQITQMTQPPPKPRFGALQLPAFPKTKITFEKKVISDCWWDWGKYNRAADGNWENWVRSSGASFEGDWCIIVLCTVFLISCIFFNKYLYFSYYMATYLPYRPYMCVNMCVYIHEIGKPLYIINFSIVL